MSESIKPLSDSEMPSVAAAFKCGNWFSIQVGIPVENDGKQDVMVVSVFAKIDGSRLLEVTTKNPECFIVKESILQIHWQECMPWEGNEPKLIFVAQRGFNVTETFAETYLEWVRKTLEANKDCCPKNYQPVICDETSSYFLKAPVQP